MGHGHSHGGSCSPACGPTSLTLPISKLVVDGIGNDCCKRFCVQNADPAWLAIRQDATVVLPGAALGDSATFLVDEDATLTLQAGHGVTIVGPTEIVGPANVRFDFLPKLCGCPGQGSWIKQT